jgi:hypothetical protein
MRPQSVTQSGVGTSALLCPDTNRNPFRVDFVAKVGGTVTDFAIEYTKDNPFAPDFDPGTATWFPTTVTGASATAEGSIQTTARAVRINIDTGDGSVELTLLQPGHGPGG